MTRAAFRPINRLIKLFICMMTMISMAILFGCILDAAKADDMTMEDSPAPPYQALAKTAAYDGENPTANGAITYTISFVKTPSNDPVTLGITDTIPSPLSILADSIESTPPGSSTVQGQVITWTATFSPSETAEDVTISYIVRIPPCVATTQTVTNTVILQELTNSVMVTPTTVFSQTSAAVQLEQASCQVFLPVVSAPPFPQLLNGDLEQGSGVGWTELVNGNSGALIYPRSSVPSDVLVGNDSAYIAWLGGIPNSTNLLEQAVSFPGNYGVYLSLRYFTASNEDDCSADTAEVYAGSIKLKSYGLCNSQETNQWRADLIDLSSLKGSSFVLKFKTVLNGQRNSNWFLDDLELCGKSPGAPPGAPQCPN